MEQKSGAGQTIDQKVEEQRENKAKEEAEQRASKVVHKYGLTAGGVAGLIGGAGILAVSAGVKKAWGLVYPPKIKKYAALTVTALFLYGATHPSTAMHKLRDGYTIVTDSAKMYLTSEKEKKSLKEKIEEASQGKATLQDAYQKKEAEAQSKEQKLSDYEKKNNELSTQKRILEEKTKVLEQQNKSLTDILKDNQGGADKQPAPLNEPLYNYSQGSQQATQKEIPQNPSAYNIGSRPRPSSFQGLSSAAYELLRNSEKIICVDKKKNKLILFEKNKDIFERRAVYNCSTGVNSSPKRAEGDKATPDGVGKIYDEFSPADRNPLFGAGGYRINFQGQSWDGILICGTDLEERVRAIARNQSCSNGGIIMNNKDLLDLKSRIGPGYGGVGVVVGDLQKILSK